MNYLLSLFVILQLASCAKPLVRGKERIFPPISRTFHNTTDEAFEASKKALPLLGYDVRIADRPAGTIRSEWRPTRAASHYTDFFDEKDYGTVGAYYRLDIRITEEKGKSRVSVAAPVKSVPGHQKSSYREERRVLKKIADLLRKDDFEMTNLGVE